ncbi:hypothetical protein A2U01_0115595, partial [Trifolium medium]|nr:hypothetical protein [Trifolium medium]
MAMLRVAPASAARRADTI